MKIFGYPVNGEKLEELIEVTFQAEPQKLKELAKFLEAMAVELENDREGFGHGHAKDFCKNWSSESPEIIVFKPNS